MTTANEMWGGCDKIDVDLCGGKLTVEEREALLKLASYVHVCKYHEGEVELEISTPHPLCGHYLRSSFTLYPDFIKDWGFTHIVERILMPKIQYMISKHNRCHKARAIRQQRPHYDGPWKIK